MIDLIFRRPIFLLAIVVMAQVMLLAYQIKGDHDVRLIRYWAVALVTPIERVGSWSMSKMGGAWSGYVGLHNARSENNNMRSELDQLRIRNAELSSRAAEAERLEAILNFRNAHPEAQLLAAQVIGSSADPASHTLFINRGEHDRLKLNMGVITSEGIVGKIVEVLPDTAQVLLINDKDSGVGAMFAASRTHGVVKGSGDPEPHMEYVVNDEKVTEGEAIVTSGEDHIFPKDLPVGTVRGATPGNPFQVIRVLPAARLDRLEDVIVLLTQQQVVFPKPAVTAVASPTPQTASTTPGTTATTANSAGPH
ncbi:MAG TPA: rod shape-determining protein MreC [Candidatus Acidoferrales bacterium]